MVNERMEWAEQSSNDIESALVNKAGSFRRVSIDADARAVRFSYKIFSCGAHYLHPNIDVKWVLRLLFGFFAGFVRVDNTTMILLMLNGSFSWCVYSLPRPTRPCRGVRELVSRQAVSFGTHSTLASVISTDLLSILVANDTSSNDFCQAFYLFSDESAFRIPMVSTAFLVSF